MPFEIRKSGDQWCVYTQGTDKKHGCHPSKKEATTQLRALYANVPEASTKSLETWNVWALQVTPDVAEYNAVGGDNTKACANCQFFDSPNGCLIVQGDIAPTGISRFWQPVQEYVADPIAVEVTNWPDVVASKEAGVIDTVKDWITNLFNRGAVVAPASEGAVGLKPIYVTKDLDGTMRATMLFSNNFQDRHDQTIPEVIHEEYLNWVDRTKLYPEFQIYHEGSKSRWGQGELVTRIGNFTLVSGPVDPGKEALAEAFANDPNTGVSNGYYALYTPDRKEFVAWYPFEVSALPLSASANVWMGDAQALESEGFLLKPEHKALLMGKGVDENFLNALEADILARGTQVTQQGVASKAVDQAPTPEDTATNTANVPITQQVLVDVIGRFAETLNARFNALEEGQKALSTQVVKKQEDTVADQIMAAVGQLPQGFKATEDPNNKPAVGAGVGVEAELQKEFNWLDVELDKVMKQALPAVNGVQ